jgi:hypothetical protein
MNKWVLRWIATAFLVGLLVVTACSPATVIVEREVERAAQATVVVREVEKEVTMVVEKEVVAEPGQPPAADSDKAGAAGEGEGGVPLGSPRSASRMIIKNAELRLLVENTAVAIDRVTQVAEDTFGYVLSSRTWYQDDYQYATITLGVPAEEYEGALRRLRGLGLRVLDESASGEDVTDQYVDLQSRLRNLEATEATIRSFLEKAETVEESLRVNQQLSEITEQIEEIKGKMNYLKDRSSYSTITVHLEPQLPTPTPTATPTATATPTPTPTPTPLAWQPEQTFKSATNVSVRLLRGIGDLLIWIVVVLGPFLIVLALVVWLAIWFRRRRPRPEGKKAEAAPAPAPEDKGAEPQAK